jgi:tol-pal system protein YbgF
MTAPRLTSLAPSRGGVRPAWGDPAPAGVVPMLRAARWVVLGAVLIAGTAHAALFEDEEARKAILDLRQRVDQSIEQLRTRQAEQAEQFRRSLLDLNNQIEALKAEIARLRGTNEQLARDLAEVQRQQKDLRQIADDRLRKLEPQPVTLDGKEFVAEPDERRVYDEAMAQLRKGDFAAAATGFAAFLKRYPKSGYVESAQFWLGNAQYGKREYREAITTFRALIAAAPESPRVPEALLSIANCQVELKDVAGARKTLDGLVKSHPKSEAAQAARERLATMK